MEDFKSRGLSTKTITLSQKIAQMKCTSAQLGEPPVSYASYGYYNISWRATKKMHELMQQWKIHCQKIMIKANPIDQSQTGMERLGGGNKGMRAMDCTDVPILACHVIKLLSNNFMHHDLDNTITLSSV